jgi:heat shock protein HspQ
MFGCGPVVLESNETAALAGLVLAHRRGLEPFAASWELRGQTRRGAPTAMDVNKAAKFGIGQQVRHRFFPFRGIIFDVDPQFANTDEWWSSIPEEIRPVKNQPFYHLLAENDSSYYVAYVSEQNLLPDDAPEPVNHPQVPEMFEIDDHGMYKIRTSTAH